MKKSERIVIDIEDELMLDILKDTLADSRTPKNETIMRIFDIGLSIVASHVSNRCPRLAKNLDIWLEVGGDTLP